MEKPSLKQLSIVQYQIVFPFMSSSHENLVRNLRNERRLQMTSFLSISFHERDPDLTISFWEWCNGKISWRNDKIALEILAMIILIFIF